MSNLLKSKFFFGVMMVAVMFVGALALATTADAQTAPLMVVNAKEFTYSGVMRSGMSGPGIGTLQAALNTVNTGLSTIVVDSKFGPATMGAVQRFQSTHGLVADGVVGPMTGAALGNATRSLIIVPGPGTPTPSPLCPNGMTYASSCTLPPAAATVPLCPNGMTLASNCMVSPSGATVPLCPNGMTLSSNCTSNSSTPPSSGNDNNLSGGETSISDVNVNDADDDTISEGANKAPVAELEFDVDDADATLSRADIVFQAANGADESDAWKVFDSVYLMDGSRVVASVSADDEDAWEDADDVISGGTNQASRVRFNNIDEDYQEGDTASLWIAVDVASSVDGADPSDDNADWTVGVEENGLRFTDGAGLDSVVDSSETANFSIEEAGGQSEFTVDEASNSPDANTIEVKSTTSVEEIIAIFTAEADEDGADVKINDFPVKLLLTTIVNGPATGTPTFDDVISDVYVTLDGTRYTGDYVADSCGAGKDLLSECVAGDTGTFNFDDIDDDDVVVSSGDEMEVKVSVKFKSQGGTGAEVYGNGTTIRASAFLGTGASNNNVEDADSGDDIGDTDGNEDGQVITLAGTGLMIDGVSESAVRTFVADDVNESDQGTFKVVFDLTAFGDDVYIDRTSPVLDNTAVPPGVYALTSASYSKGGTGTSTATGVLNATSGDFESGTNSWLIREGDTARFTLEVTVTATASGSASITLENLTFAATDVSGTASFLVPNEPEFETDAITLLDL